MGTITMLMKTFSSGLGISVTVLIIGVFRMTNRAHPCCLYLEEDAPALIMIGSASTIL